MTIGIVQSMRDAIRQIDVVLGGSACRVCGCTDNAACDPPCCWIEVDLCSSCAIVDVHAPILNGATP